VKLSQKRLARPSVGGMLATRQGALILAVLCAACAAGVLMFALSSYKKNAAAPPPAQATVLVATGAIPKGTAWPLVAAGNLYKSTPIIATQLAPGAVSNSSSLAGTVAQSDILPGQQITTADFSAVVSAVSVLAPNQRAVSIAPDEIHGDLDVLSSGDHVDLYAELTQNSKPALSLLDPNVVVLKAPGGALAGAAVSTGTAPAGSTTPASSATTAGVRPVAALVLAVTASLAPDVALTADTGKLWLTLRPANATPTPGGVTTDANVLALASVAATFNSNSKTTTTRTHP
jgi:Flp pilus assembly protein CpaB